MSKLEDDQRALLEGLQHASSAGEGGARLPGRAERWRRSSCAGAPLTAGDGAERIGRCEAGGNYPPVGWRTVGASGGGREVGAPPDGAGNGCRRAQPLERLDRRGTRFGRGRKGSRGSHVRWAVRSRAECALQRESARTQSRVSVSVWSVAYAPGLNRIRPKSHLGDECAARIPEVRMGRLGEAVRDGPQPWRFRPRAEGGPCPP